MEQYVNALEAGPVHPFADWPGPVPSGPPGVYTIWEGSRFIYVGISYRDASETTNRGARGLAGRLNTHASGRRSGDQFNIYICDRFVLPTLTSAEITAVAEGRLSLDARTRHYIRERLAYRFVITPTGVIARQVEDAIRSNGLPAAGFPFLNPKAQPVPLV